jgi:hypothetical protein
MTTWALAEIERMVEYLRGDKTRVVCLLFHKPDSVNEAPGWA